MTAVGDGGAGPYRGVLPLGEALERMEGLFGDLSALGRDCPLSADVDFGELAGQPDDWDEHVARLESDPAYEARYERLAETYLASRGSTAACPWSTTAAATGSSSWYYSYLEFGDDARYRPVEPTDQGAPP
ncbi:hypothetical protein [Phytohabitans suffuscus]|uniref:Uncharacterized protein n=1 Tax=Phytohabitans suffuscus TaxID=624315 RepID=A0A6F8YYW0_9ACTN|nr:hypothetical protein [Phytohabitans suffuscus]BCB91256.1 hypothetical protein Psuf_085690 [Phytohabitans suffuscus]